MVTAFGVQLCQRHPAPVPPRLAPAIGACLAIGVTCCGATGPMFGKYALAGIGREHRRAAACCPAGSGPGGCRGWRWCRSSGSARRSCWRRPLTVVVTAVVALLATAACLAGPGAYMPGHRGQSAQRAILSVDRTRVLRPVRCAHPEARPDGALLSANAADHLGGCDGRLPPTPRVISWPPAHPGAGGRRIQRHRPGADPGGSSANMVAQKTDSLLHPRRADGNWRARTAVREAADIASWVQGHCRGVVTGVTV